MKKMIFIIGLIVILILGIIFVSTGRARTDVFLREFSIDEKCNQMTIKVGVSSSTGYIRNMKQISGGMNPYLTFYSTFGINSKLGAEDTFEINLDENMDEIYFYQGNGGYVKVLEKDKETAEWKIIRNEEADKYKDYEKVTSIKSDKVITTVLVKYDDTLYGQSKAVIDYAPNPNGPIGVIDKLIDSQYVPQVNGKTNVEEILNAKVDYVGESSLILNYNNIYVLFEKIEE